MIESWRILTDEDFNGLIIRAVQAQTARILESRSRDALLARIADPAASHTDVLAAAGRQQRLNLVRAIDVGLRACTDAEVLEWAARDNRVVFTHDVSTLSPTAWAMVAEGQPMAGVIQVRQAHSPQLVVEGLVLLLECSEPDEYRNLVFHLQV